MSDTSLPSYTYPATPPPRYSMATGWAHRLPHLISATNSPSDTPVIRIIGVDVYGSQDTIERISRDNCLESALDVGINVIDAVTCGACSSESSWRSRAWAFCCDCICALRLC